MRLLPSTPFGSSSARILRNFSALGYRRSILARASFRSSSPSGSSIFAQCVLIPYVSPSASSSFLAYDLNARVMASLEAGSGLGRYMMIPIQLCKPGLVRSCPSFVAGESGDLLPALHRCSMGAGAGIPSRSIIAKRSFMYARSAPVLPSTSSPVLNAISYTCCSPPQSNPKIWSLQSHRVPELRRQNSASAALHRLTCAKSRGFTLSSSSRSCPNPMPPESTSGATSRNSRTIGSTFFVSEYALVGLGTAASGASGLDPTTTTVLVCGIHMYRMCLCSSSHRAWFL
mmetsp:Transcript_9365/g.42639  ORF Transcript_9365/g.42639 Transcript_9365/m.42639 type:complete len:287 (-) Transcript_9365:1073-1933(-)